VTNTTVITMNMNTYIRISAILNRSRRRYLGLSTWIHKRLKLGTWIHKRLKLGTWIHKRLKLGTWIHKRLKLV